MPFTLTMPKLSPTMEEGVIVKWCKQENDYVESGAVLFEVATDKSTVEHTALDEGYLRQILIREGQSALVNQAVAIFTQTQDESIEGYLPTGVTAKAKIVEDLPSPSLSSDGVTIKDPSIATFVQPAFTPEKPLFDYQFSLSKDSDHLTASPLAKQLAKSKGIDLTTVKGTGPLGRIVSKDLDLGQLDLPVTFGRKQLPTEVPGSFEEKPLSMMRKTIASRLQAAKTFIPHFYVSTDVMCENLLSIKEQLKVFGLKVSVNDLVIKAAALALRDHPKINSGFDSEKNCIIEFKTVDISLAVGIEDGLITPIIRHADFKNVGEISLEVKKLALRAKEGKLERHEYMGGSFTISNLGMYDVSDFVAIINPPQAAILAVSSICDSAIIKDHQVVAGKVMRLTLSLDHRVVDGVDAAVFCKTLKKYLEHPAALLL